MQMMRFCSSSLSFILKTLSNLTFDLVMIFIDIVHLVTIFNFNSPTIPCFFFFFLVADQYILFNDTGQVFLPPISFLQQQNICSFVIFFFKKKMILVM